MNIFNILLDLLKNEDYNSVFKFVGVIFVLIFPSLIYFVLFDLSFMLNLDFPVILLLAVVCNTILIALVALLVYEFRFTFFVLDLKISQERNRELIELAKRIESENTPSKISGESSLEEKLNTSKEKIEQAKLLLEEMTNHKARQMNILIDYHKSSFTYVIVFVFSATILLIFYWMLKIDVKNILSIIDYFQLFLVIFLFSCALSIKQFYDFNNNGNALKIGYKSKIVQILLILISLVYLNIK